MLATVLAPGPAGFGSWPAGRRRGQVRPTPRVPKPSSRREAAGRCPRQITGTCGRQLSVWLSVHPSLDFPAAHPLIYHLSSSD